MTVTELREFAEKVERVCDFLIDKAKDADIDANDLRVLQDLKEKAANIHMGTDKIDIGLQGLSDAVGAL